MPTIVQGKSRKVSAELQNWQFLQAQTLTHGAKKKKPTHIAQQIKRADDPQHRACELQREGSSVSRRMSHKLDLSQESLCVLGAKTGAAHCESDSMTQWSMERLRWCREEYHLCIFFFTCGVWYICTVSSDCIFYFCLFVYKLFLQVIEVEHWSNAAWKIYQSFLPCWCRGWGCYSGVNKDRIHVSGSLILLQVPGTVSSKSFAKVLK